MLRWMIWNQTEAFQWWCRNWHAAMSNRTRGMFLPLSCPWEGSSSQQYIVVLFPSNCKFIRMASIKRSSSLKQRERVCVRVSRFSASPCSMLFIHSGLRLWQNQIYRWACSFLVVTGDCMLHHCLVVPCVRRQCSHVYPCSNPKMEAAHDEL